MPSRLMTRRAAFSACRSPAEPRFHSRGGILTSLTRNCDKTASGWPKNLKGTNIDTFMCFGGNTNLIYYVDFLTQ